METSLHDSQIYQSIFNSSVEGIVVLDREGIIQKNNHAFAELFQYQASELQNQNIKTLLPQLTPKKLNKLTGQGSNNALGDEIIYVGLNKTGQKLQLKVRFTSIFNNGDSVILGYVYNRTHPNSTKVNENGDYFKDDNNLLQGNRQNSTKLKSAFQALEREKRILQKYFETTATIVVVINNDQKIYTINTKGCEVMGYDCDEIIGKDWFENFIPQHDRKKLSDMFQAFMDGRVKPPELFESRILVRGKKAKLIRWSSTILEDENGQNVSLLCSGVDISEQIKAEKELRASEEKNKAILLAIPDVITIHDEIGTILDIQVPDQSYLFAPKKFLIGKNVADVLDSKTAKQIRSMFIMVLKTKKIQVLELSMPSYGGIVNYECRFVPLTKNKILTIARDITETKATHHMLHIRNRALEVAGNGIVIVDAVEPKMPIIYCNGAFSKITGYNKDEVLGRNCNFLQKDDRDQVGIKKIGLAIKKGEPYQTVLRNYRKDNSMFWNELSITPLYDKNNNVSHYIGVQNDITEILEGRRKLEAYTSTLERQVEERTRELQDTVQQLVKSNINLEDQIQETKIAEQIAMRNQELFVAITHNFPKGIIAVFNSNYEIIYLEGEALRRHNLNKIDFEGVPLEEVKIIAKDRIPLIKKYVEKTLNGESQSFEVKLDVGEFAVNSTPLLNDDDKKKVLALFVYHNISEQKKSEQDLLRALRIEQDLNKLKSRFLSMASHEFRTPLSAILSSAILIEKQNGKDKEDQRKKHVDRIRSNVKNLVIILNDFLSLGKLEEGKTLAQPSEFEIINFLKELIEEIEASKKEGQQILFNFKIDAILVYLDKKLLSHIIVNLLSNACKYSHKNSEITLQLQSSGDLLKFEISDDGIGIPIDEQENMFKRFYRAVNATNIQGTGLGLHIVQQYSELMGGEVSFNSVPGDGSTFIVELPLRMKMREL